MMISLSKFLLMIESIKKILDEYESASGAMGLEFFLGTVENWDRDSRQFIVSRTQIAFQSTQQLYVGTWIIKSAVKKGAAKKSPGGGGEIILGRERIPTISPICPPSCQYPLLSLLFWMIYLYKIIILIYI